MKKLLSVVTLLGALAGAAAAAPYTLPSPAGGALTPYDWQPVYSVEGIYSFAADSDAPDTLGVRGTFSLYSNAESSVRHQFNVNVGIQTGEKTVDEVKNTLTLVPVTVGYNINLGITDNVFLYVGAKAGYAWATAELEDEEGTDTIHRGGFTYSVGAGIKVQCAPTTYVHAGYEFGRTYIESQEPDCNHYIYGAHTVTVGVGCTF